MLCHVVCYFTIETSAFTHNVTGLTVTISCRNIFEFRVHKWYMKVLIYLFTDKMHTGNTLKLICIGTTKHFCFLVKIPHDEHVRLEAYLHYEFDIVLIPIIPKSCFGSRDWDFSV